MLSSFSTWLMLERDNCLIYEFYNVVEFLSSSLILAELFIKWSLSVPGQKGKEKYGAKNNCLHRGAFQSSPCPVEKERDVCFPQI